jgi:hypothetical protein
MLQTLKLNNKKWEKSLFYEEKSLVGLTPVIIELACVDAITKYEETRAAPIEGKK